MGDRITITNGTSKGGRGRIILMRPAMREAESLDDAPQDLRLPSCPPGGPSDRPRDLYGSLSGVLGIKDKIGADSALSARPALAGPLPAKPRAIRRPGTAGRRRGPAPGREPPGQHPPRPGRGPAGVNSGRSRRAGPGPRASRRRRTGRRRRSVRSTCAALPRGRAARPGRRRGRCRRPPPRAPAACHSAVRREARTLGKPWPTISRAASSGRSPSRRARATARATISRDRSQSSPSGGHSVKRRPKRRVTGAASPKARGRTTRAHRPSHMSSGARMTSRACSTKRPSAPASGPG